MRARWIPLINFVVDCRDFMLQSPCYGVMPRWVSDTTLDNACAIDRHVNSPVIEARQCQVPACGRNEEGAQTGNNAIRSEWIGCSLPRTIENQELLLDENGLGEYGTGRRPDARIGQEW